MKDQYHTVYHPYLYIIIWQDMRNSFAIYGFVCTVVSHVRDYSPPCDVHHHHHHHYHHRPIPPTSTVISKQQQQATAAATTPTPTPTSNSINDNTNNFSITQCCDHHGSTDQTDDVQYKPTHFTITIRVGLCSRFQRILYAATTIYRSLSRRLWMPWKKERPGAYTVTATNNTNNEQKSEE